MGDSLPRTSMNHRAKFDAARFISGGEIRNRTNKLLRLLRKCCTHKLSRFSTSLSMAYCMWDFRIHFARYDAALFVQIWILWLYNLENNSAVLRRGSAISKNWSSRWLTCKMGCSRQSLTKLAPVNSLNVCELVFVPQVDVLNTCFNVQTIYQVGGLQ